MAHCGCDPELEVSPSPLFFLPFLWLLCLPLLTVPTFAFVGLSEWGALSGPGSGVGCGVLGHGLDLLIDNQANGLVQVRTVWGTLELYEGQDRVPQRAPPHCYRHRGGWMVWMQLGEQDPLLPLPLAPSSPSFPLLFCCSELSLLGRGGLFCPKTHTHTQNLKDTS